MKGDLNTVLFHVNKHLNYHAINWESTTVKKSSPKKEVQVDLTKLASDFHLTQIHETPIPGTATS